jgi:hypothetical protein
VENYPDEAPIIEVKSLEAVTDSQIDSLQTFLNEKVKYNWTILLILRSIVARCSLYMFIINYKVEENLGMVMVFTLISETQEYLNQAVEDEKKSREEEKLRKIKEAEKAELVKNINNFSLKKVW